DGLRGDELADDGGGDDAAAGFEPFVGSLDEVGVDVEGHHRGPLSVSASTVSRHARTASRSARMPVRQRRVMGRSRLGGWQWGQRWAWVVAISQAMSRRRAGGMTRL